MANIEQFIRKLSVTAMLLLASLSTFAYDFEVDGIYYNIVSISDLTCEVTSSGNDSLKYSGDVVIPSSVNYKGKALDVVSIGERAFLWCSDLTSITISDKITSIGESAFFGCSGLTSIKIPECVTLIEDDVFNICSSLTAVYISDLKAWCNIKFRSNTSNPLCYAHNLYLNNKLLTSITIPEGITSIGNNTFAGCSCLTSINIPDKVTTIGSASFFGCTGLKSVNIGNGVTSIGSSAFSHCTSLTSVNIGNGVTSIESNTFRECSGLTSVTFGNGVSSINEFAFWDCNNITSVTAGNFYALYYLFRPLHKQTIDTITLAEDYIDDFLLQIDEFSNMSKLIIKTNKKLIWEDPISNHTTFVTNQQYMNVEVIVPNDMLSYYQTADIWKDFWNLKSSDDDSETPDEPKTCEAPTITFDNDAKKLVFTSATDGAKYHCTIKSEDMMTEMSVDSELAMTGVYTIIAYASADGMNNSEKTTAKLCWVSAAIESDGILNAKAERGVVVSTNGGNVNINGTINGETIEVYNVGGSKLKAVKANGGNSTINGLQSGTYIIKIGGTRVKIIL